METIKTNTPRVISEAEREYYKNGLLESVETLFDQSDLDRITTHLSDLMFYALNPDYSKDLEKERIADFATTQSCFISYLIKVFVCLQDYSKYKIES